MVKIESKKSVIHLKAQELFDYLAVPQNYEVLMPNKVRSFEATENAATLDIEGIGKVELAITERVAPFKIVMTPQNKVPFKFFIQWDIVAQGDFAETQAVIHADLNFMMKMMAESLLQNFVNVQVEKLTQHLNH